MARVARVFFGMTAGLALPLLGSTLAAQEARPAADSANARTVVLAGVVRDTSGMPLSGAEVRVADRVTLSDYLGGFTLTVPRRDTTQVLVRRIGFRPADALLAVEPHVRRVELAVKMIPSAVRLGTIVIEGKAMDRHLWMNGFYERQRLGGGHFFGPVEMARHAGTVSGKIYEVPSLNVERGPFGDAFVWGRAGIRACRLSVFVDGILVRWADEIGLDRVVKKQDILAMEVYARASQVPARFGYSSAVVEDGFASSADDAAAAEQGINPKAVSRGQCGAIVIWTKPFEPKER